MDEESAGTGTGRRRALPQLAFTNKKPRFGTAHAFVVIIEMKHQGFIKDDPVARITIKASGRYEDEESEIEIPSDNEVRDIYAAADIMGDKTTCRASSPTWCSSGRSIVRPLRTI